MTRTLAQLDGIHAAFAAGSSDARTQQPRSAFPRLCAALVDMANTDPTTPAAGHLRVKLASNAVQWAKDGTCRPDMVEAGRSCLYWACKAGLHSVVQYWVDHNRADVLQVLHTGVEADSGHTPFGVACQWSRKAQAGAAWQVGARGCAIELGRLQTLDPAVVGGSGDSQLRWACHAGLGDVLSRWAKNPRTTDQLLTRPLASQEPLFVGCCYQYAAVSPSDDAVLAAGLRACAVAVGTSGKCRPDTMDGLGRCYLYLASSLGLHEVVQFWLEHNRGEVDVVLQFRCGKDFGDNAFTVACSRSYHSTSRQELRAGAATCARLLSTVPACGPADVGGDGRVNLYLACRAGLKTVVEHWVNDDRCAEALESPQRDNKGYHLFGSLCQLSLSTQTESPSRAPAVRACVVAVGTSGKCRPNKIDGQSRSHLYLACDTGLPQVVQYWIEHDKDRLLSTLADRAAYVESYASAFSKACWWAREALPGSPRATGAKACAELLAQLPECSPTHMSAAGGVNIGWASACGLIDVVQKPLQDEERCTEELLDTARNNHGNSVFYWTCDRYSRRFDREEAGPDAADLTARILACAVALGTSGKVRPDTVDSNGRTHLYQACNAGLDTVVQYWIEHDKDRLLAVLHCGTKDKDNGHTPLTIACYRSREWTGAALGFGATACAKTLAGLQACSPADIGGWGAPSLGWASGCGMVNVVHHGLHHPHCTTELLNTLRKDNGHSIFHWACDRYSARFDNGQADADPLKSDLTARIRECAVAVGTSGKCRPDTVDGKGQSHLLWACKMGLGEVLRHWLDSKAISQEQIVATFVQAAQDGSALAKALLESISEPASGESTNDSAPAEGQ